MKKIVLSVLLVGFLSACNSFKVDSWMAEGVAPRPIGKTAVLGMAESKGLAMQFEQDFVTDLKEKGIDADALHSVASLSGKLTKEELTALLKKGMYITNSEAESEAKARSRKVDFDFIAKRYTSVPDSAIKISEGDINKYYNENINDFQQDATRDIEYVTFAVKPSEEDKKMALEWITKAKEVFGAENTDVVQYVKMNSDAP